MSVTKQWSGSEWELIGGGGSGGGSDLLVAERTITAEDGAQTSITFTDLDGNAAGGYLLTHSIYAVGTETVGFNLYINGDTSNSNYTGQRIYAQSSTILSAPSTGVLIGMTGAQSRYSSGTTDILDGLRPFFMSKIKDAGSSYKYLDLIATEYSTDTNITSITITADTASYIGVGSAFRLYKRK